MREKEQAGEDLIARGAQIRDTRDVRVRLRDRGLMGPRMGVANQPPWLLDPEVVSDSNEEGWREPRRRHGYNSNDSKEPGPGEPEYDQQQFTSDDNLN